MDPASALTEWRELEILAEDLRDVATRIEGITKGMQATMPRVGTVNSAARKLRRMSERWEQRAHVAKEDAIRDHVKTGEIEGRDQAFEWSVREEDRIREDKALGHISSALDGLAAAQPLLDAPTRERMEALRMPIADLYAEVYERDIGRLR